MARVLVMEDNVKFRDMLCQMLSRAGYEVTEASDGNEGIRSFRANPPDLVVTDILMPNKEGIEVIVELQKDFPGVKIIAISGGGYGKPEDYTEMAQMFNVQRTFTKPFGEGEFLQAVKELTT